MLTSNSKRNLIRREVLRKRMTIIKWLKMLIISKMKRIGNGGSIMKTLLTSSNSEWMTITRESLDQ